MRQMRLIAALVIAFVLAAQGLLSQSGRAAEVGLAPAAGFCLSDEDGKGHAPDRDCVVHCLLGNGANGSAPSDTDLHPRSSWHETSAGQARSFAKPRHRLFLDRAPRAPPGVT
jgi:hypothetical protein